MYNIGCNMNIYYEYIKKYKIYIIFMYIYPKPQSAKIEKKCHVSKMQTFYYYVMLKICTQCLSFFFLYKIF